MKHIRKRISKIIDEMMLFFFSVGGQKIHIDYEHLDVGYRIAMESDYDPASREDLEHLDRYLNGPKDESILEYYWELAGERESGRDRPPKTGTSTEGLPRCGQIIFCISKGSPAFLGNQTQFMYIDILSNIVGKWNGENRKAGR